MARALFICTTLCALVSTHSLEKKYGETPETRLWQAAPGDTPFKNILSIDGGGIRGIIPV
jgi:hypothetical protein